MVHLSVMFLFFGNIMLFGIVYSYKYNSLITHVKSVTPSNNTECTGTCFERI